MQHYSKRSSCAEKVLFSKKRKRNWILTTSTSHSFSHCKRCSLRFFLPLQREKLPFGPLLAAASRFCCSIHGNCSALRTKSQILQPCDRGLSWKVCAWLREYDHLKFASQIVEDGGLWYQWFSAVGVHACMCVCVCVRERARTCMCERLLGDVIFSFPMIYQVLLPLSVAFGGVDRCVVLLLLAVSCRHASSFQG